MGAARFLRGLNSLLDPRDLAVIVNTGDDDSFFGLHVSPDVDTVIYTLAGVVNALPGWGIRDDRFACLTTLARFYDETWFRLGDKDLATHIFRSDALRRGRTLTAVTAAIARSYGVRATILPMCDAPVRTFVSVARRAPLPFQRYLVQNGGRGRVTGIRFRGARAARPVPAALRALRQSAYLIVPPSNPLVSIGPILAVPGMRAALTARRDRVAAISPIIAGAPVKGPLHHMLAGLGHEVSPVGVAGLYRHLAALFVIDRRDAALAPRIAELGMRPVVTDTLMTSAATSRRLAATVLSELRR